VQAQRSAGQLGGGISAHIYKFDYRWAARVGGCEPYGPSLQTQVQEAGILELSALLRVCMQTSTPTYGFVQCFGVVRRLRLAAVLDDALTWGSERMRIWVLCMTF